MGRIIAEIVDDKLIVTRYESEGSVIPDKITQDKKVVAIIKGNLDTDGVKSLNEEVKLNELTVSREEFLIKLLGMSEECVERYSTYGKGLYSESDMRKGITWAEVAYLVHYVGGVPESIDWNTTKPRCKDRVCVLQVFSSNDGYGGSRKVLDERLASYKNRIDMEYYISSIISGKRFIPLPVYCAFVDLLHNEDINIDLELDMMFKKISKEEFEGLF